MSICKKLSVLKYCGEISFALYFVICMLYSERQINNKGQKRKTSIADDFD